MNTIQLLFTISNLVIATCFHTTSNITEAVIISQKERYQNYTNQGSTERNKVDLLNHAFNYSPTLAFNVQRMDNSACHYIAEVQYSNVWEEVENVTGIGLDFICGNKSISCECEYHVSQQKAGCFHRFRNITDDLCSHHLLCSETFEVIPGKCCARLTIFTSQLPQMNFWNTWSTEEKINHESPCDSKVMLSTASSDIKKIIYILSSVFVIVIVLLACIVIARCRKKTTGAYTSVDQMESGWTHLNKHTKKQTILVMHHPETREHNEQVEDFVSQLEQSWNCKVVSGNCCQDEIATAGISEWAAHSVQTADKIVVISSKCAFHNDQERKQGQQQSCLDNTQDEFLRKIFTMQWTTLVNNSELRDDYTRVYNVRFASTDPSNLLKDIVHGRHFELPKDLYLLTDTLQNN